MSGKDGVSGHAALLLFSVHLFSAGQDFCRDDKDVVKLLVAAHSLRGEEGTRMSFGLFVFEPCQRRSKELSDLPFLSTKHVAAVHASLSNQPTTLKLHPRINRLTNHIEAVLLHIADEREAGLFFFGAAGSRDSRPGDERQHAHGRVDPAHRLERYKHLQHIAWIRVIEMIFCQRGVQMMLIWIALGVANQGGCHLIVRVWLQSGQSPYTQLLARLV